MELDPPVGFAEMPYATEPFPYDRPPQQMTPEALKKVFTVVIEQMACRVKNISGYLYRMRGVSIIPSSPDEAIDQLPGLIASLGGWRQLSDEEHESLLIGSRPQAIDMMREILPQRMLDGETLSMVFDGALLWGEAFRTRYPEACWALGAKPKSSVNYGDPVLIGVDMFREEFDTDRELHGHVGLLMAGDPSDWTLSRIMKMRAFQLALGPDPRLGPMSDWEKELHGLD